MGEWRRESPANARHWLFDGSWWAKSWEGPGVFAITARHRSRRWSWNAISSSTRAWLDSVTAPCAGSSRRSGIARTLASESRKSISGRSASHGSNPTDGESRHHVGTSEQQLVGEGGEVKVALGGARGRARTQRPPPHAPPG